MIKIADMPSMSAPRRTRALKKGAQSVGFDSTLAETSGTESATPTPTLSSISSLTSLMQAQETGDLFAQQKALCDRGVALLASLEELQAQVLVGAHDEATLQRLADLAKNQVPGGDHPELMSVVEQIEQRVAIELAKIEMSLKSMEKI